MGKIVNASGSSASDGKDSSDLNQLESLPGHWPLTKLTLPLKFGVNRPDDGAEGHSFGSIKV